MATTPMNTLEQLLMAHRYLYYVVAMPVISDSDYDKLESFACQHLPKGSPMHEPGSDLASSYSPHIRLLAMTLKQIK